MSAKGKFSKVYAGAGAKVYRGISPFPSPAWTPPIGKSERRQIGVMDTAILAWWIPPYWRDGCRHIGVVDTAILAWWIPPYWRDVLGIKDNIKTNEKLMKSGGAKKRNFWGKKEGKKGGKNAR